MKHAADCRRGQVMAAHQHRAVVGVPDLDARVLRRPCRRPTSGRRTSSAGAASWTVERGQAAWHLAGRGIVGGHRPRPCPGVRLVMPRPAPVADGRGERARRGRRRAGRAGPGLGAACCNRDLARPTLGAQRSAGRSTKVIPWAICTLPALRSSWPRTRNGFTSFRSWSRSCTRPGACEDVDLEGPALGRRQHRVVAASAVPESIVAPGTTW